MKEKTLMELIHEVRRHILTIEHDIPKTDKQNYKYHVESLKKSFSKAAMLIEKIPDEITD